MYNNSSGVAMKKTRSITHPKLFLLAVLISLPAILYSFDFITDVAPRWAGIEAAYGPDDIMLAPIISFRDWYAFYFKPVAVRYSPITQSLSFSAIAEFYPLALAGNGFWIFADNALNPFIYSGITVPYTFQTLRLPLGIGIQGPVAKEFFLGFKIYLDTAVAPAFYQVLNWDISLEYKIKLQREE